MRMVELEVLELKVIEPTEARPWTTESLAFCRFLEVLRRYGLAPTSL